MVALMGYVCPECDRYISEDELIVHKTSSHSDYIGHGGWMEETSVECPHCGYEDTAFDESYQCEVCGEASYDERICRECQMMFFGKMDEFFDGLVKEHEVDREALLDIAQQYIEQ